MTSLRPSAAAGDFPGAEQQHACSSGSGCFASAATVPIAERSAVLPTAPRRGRRQSPQGDPNTVEVSRCSVAAATRSIPGRDGTRPCSMPGVRRPRARHPDRRVRPKPARAVELIAELLQRHPLHRLLHDTTVIASPRIHLPSVAEPNQIRLRIPLRNDENQVCSRSAQPPRVSVDGSPNDTHLQAACSSVGARCDSRCLPPAPSSKLDNLVVVMASFFPAPHAPVYRGGEPACGGSVS